MEFKRKNKKINWNAVGTIFLAIATVVLAIATWNLANRAKESIDQASKHFQILSRPFVTVDKSFEQEGSTDRSVNLNNLGGTAAYDLTVFIYYLNHKDETVSLIFQSNKLDVGMLYPKENKKILLLDPCLFMNEMKSKTFTIDLSYRYLNQCVNYKQNISFVGNDCVHVRGHETEEYIKLCN